MRVRYTDLPYAPCPTQHSRLHYPHPLPESHILWAGKMSNDMCPSLWSHTEYLHRPETPPCSACSSPPGEGARSVRVAASLPPVRHCSLVSAGDQDQRCEDSRPGDIQPQLLHHALPGCPCRYHRLQSGLPSVSSQDVFYLISSSTLCSRPKGLLPFITCCGL